MKQNSDIKMADRIALAIILLLSLAAALMFGINLGYN